MITLHNFNEAYKHYEQHQISFRVLQDQAAVMIDVCERSRPPVTNSVAITQADVDWLLQQEEATQSYDGLLGGYVYICETAHDLLEIKGCDLNWAETHEGRWPNVTDIPMSWDVCAYLEESTGNPEWGIFMLCWSNAGGSIYYVPSHLWVQARVTEHIAVTS